MALATVKLFGVFRSDTHIAVTELEISKLSELFPALNAKVEKQYNEKKAADPSLPKPDPIRFSDAIVYVNGEKCARKSKTVNQGDEIWIMSPASGG